MQGESYRHGNSKKGASFCHKGQTGKEMTSLISSHIRSSFFSFFLFFSIQVAWVSVEACEIFSLRCTDSPVVVHQAQWLWFAGLNCSMARGILVPLSRDQTLDPCIARWILNRWTTREVPQIPVLYSLIVLGLLYKHRPVGENPTSLPLQPLPPATEGTEMSPPPGPDLGRSLLWEIG